MDAISPHLGTGIVKVVLDMSNRPRPSAGGTFQRRQQPNHFKRPAQPYKNLRDGSCVSVCVFVSVYELQRWLAARALI